MSWDPLQSNRAMALWQSSFKNSMHRRSMSSPPCGTSNRYGETRVPITPCRSKHSEIKFALEACVAERCLETHGSLRECRWHVLCLVAEWLQIPNALDLYADEMQRDRLATLLLNDVKHKNVKLLPRDELEWNRLLTGWLRRGPVVKDRLVYQLLAVDGFDGVESHHLKSYLPNVIDPGCIRQQYRLHVMAVRYMYEWFESKPEVSSLTGTDSACVVFLALVQLYAEDQKDEMIVLQAHKAKVWGEGFYIEMPATTKTCAR